MPACLPPCRCAQAEIGSLDADRPDCGRLCFAVECSPVASPAFRVRPACLSACGYRLATAFFEHSPAVKGLPHPLSLASTSSAICRLQGRGGDELAGELTRALERSMYPGPSGEHTLPACLKTARQSPAALTDWMAGRSARVGQWLSASLPHDVCSPLARPASMAALPSSSALLRP
jgi:hypothetical protein